VHATYMPEDGYWPASFEVVPPQKLALHGQDVANSLRKAASAVILRFREKNKKQAKAASFWLYLGDFYVTSILTLANNKRSFLDLFDSARSIAIGNPNSRSRVFRFLPFYWKKRAKKRFYRIPAPHYLVTHQAHLKRSPQPDFRYQGDIFYATQKAKFNSFLGEASL